MITLLNNIECFCPKYIGKKDILITGSKIYKILNPGDHMFSDKIANVIDCKGLMAFPGLIDGHVHISGGGGENGFASRLGEINKNEILLAGITTVVGLLGADNQTKSLKGLLACAKTLELGGITTYIYSGSYAVPIITFTGDIVNDMVLIEKVIGAGEVAISDHRSSHPDIKDMLNLASKTHMGGLISGKAGLLHIHVGDGKSGLSLLCQLVAKSDLPIEQFLPTHTNRNKQLFKEAIKYAKNGGNIDLTSDERVGVSVPDSIEMLMKNEVDIQRVTVSSDANGSKPGGGTNKISTLFEDITNSIREKNISPETVLPIVTENAAKRLRQYPKKGAIFEGSDADILIVDKNYKINMLFSLGKIMISSGNLVQN